MLKKIIKTTCLFLALISESDRVVYADNYATVLQSMPYAQLCNAGYNSPPDENVGGKDGYALIEGSFVNGLKDGYSKGFSAVTYTKGSEIIIVFIGTNDNIPLNITGSLITPIAAQIFSLPDWVDNNIPSAVLGTATSQDFDAINYAASMIDKFGKGKNITVTGHSLGGKLAQIVAEMKGVNAYTFNAAVVPKMWHEIIHNTNTKYAINNIIVNGEVVNEISRLGGSDYGNDIIVPPLDFTPANIYSFHKIETTIGAINNVIKHGYLPDPGLMVMGGDGYYVPPVSGSGPGYTIAPGLTSPYPALNAGLSVIGNTYANSQQLVGIGQNFNSFVDIKVIKDFNYLIEEKGLLNSYNYETNSSNKGSINYVVDWAPYAGSWVDTFDYSSKKTKNSMVYYYVKEYKDGDNVGNGYATVYTHISDEYNYLVWGGGGENGTPTVLGPGTWIIGKITSDMPKTGTAHYSGSIIGYADREINGGVDLTAHFAANSLTGTLNCKYRDNGKNFATAQLNNVTIGTPDPSAFLGGLTGSNIIESGSSIGGAFFGPKANEIGGYWKIQKADGNYGHGIFVGK